MTRHAGTAAGSWHAGQQELSRGLAPAVHEGPAAERLVRESLFFVVWSCPQTVADALLCELSGG